MGRPSKWVKYYSRVVFSFFVTQIFVRDARQNCTSDFHAVWFTGQVIAFLEQSNCKRLPFYSIFIPKMPPQGAGIGIFKPNAQNIKNCIIFKTTTPIITKFSTAIDNQLHFVGMMMQLHFVGGPNKRKMNPRWRTAAILKKNEKLPYLRNGLTDRHEILYVLVPSNWIDSWNFEFQNPRWRTAANLYKNSSGDEIANVLVNDDIAHT